MSLFPESDDVGQLELVYDLSIETLLEAIQHAIKCYDNKCNHIKCAEFKQEFLEINSDMRGGPRYEYGSSVFYILVIIHSEHCNENMCEVPRCIEIKHRRNLRNAQSYLLPRYICRLRLPDENNNDRGFVNKNLF